MHHQPLPVVHLRTWSGVAILAVVEAALYRMLPPSADQLTDSPG